jgi:type 1 glutamine amidotransferase/nicotinamidase-related amidase
MLDRLTTTRRRFRATVVACTLGLGLISAARADMLELTLRRRVDSPALGGASRVVETAATWNPKQTAAIVCDMWDVHHCLNAVRRETDMAPRMEVYLRTLRANGVTIIHAPSGCMDAYKNHPARQRAIATPRSKNPPAEIEQWCKRIPSEEQAVYPVDQTDGGEDDDPAEHARWASQLAAQGRDPRAPWKSQTALINIGPQQDYISDDGKEIWSILEDRGIEHVLLMGVHLNMCVLGRPFGLRQMAKNGKDVAVVRDLTDTMYNPLKAPFISHFNGTDRVVEHVERFVCPSVTSYHMVGEHPFRYRTDTRPRVVFLVAEDEYKTETSLPSFAARYLAKDTKYDFVFDTSDDKNTLTGSSMIDEADVLFVSARRRAFPTAQLAAVRRHVAAGKAVVGIRTASHAFAFRPNVPVPAGHDVWPTFDPDVLGGHYTNHHKVGPDVALSAAPAASENAILTGVDVSKLVGKGSLYKVNPLVASATPLLIGTILGESPEPVAWTNLTSSGGRVFYTSLGHLDDFAQPSFQRLLRNAIDWTAGRTVASTAETSSTEAIAFPK